LQAAEEPEKRERKDADVHAGDNEDVEGAGALETGLHIAT